MRLRHEGRAGISREYDSTDIDMSISILNLG
eukprot:SAG11_NODE_1017_length_6163_cov_6.440303_2_plen_31_part_00